MAKAWTGAGRIGSKADALAALQRVNQNATERGNLALVADPVQTGTTTELAGDITEVVPCDPSLLPLLPWPGGLRKGATVSAVGSTSLLMLLLAGAMRDTGQYAAVVGMPAFGALAAIQDYGIDGGRLALVPEPGPDWPTIVGALLDGVAVVIVQPPAAVPEGLAKSLSARARQKGCVLIPTRAWPGAELTIDATGRRWHGLGDGHGRLKHCDLDVSSAGRGRAIRPRTATLSLPPGVANRQWVIPPPKTTTVTEPRQAANPLWDHLHPSPPPADLWASLV